MKIETDTYDSINKNYDNAISWMKNIGVELSSGRTQHYLKIMNFLRDNYKSASDIVAKNIFPDFVSSVSEIDSFIKES
jgi:cell wall assembly regulator SMI1